MRTLSAVPATKSCVQIYLCIRDTSLYRTASCVSMVTSIVCACVCLCVCVYLGVRVCVCMYVHVCVGGGGGEVSMELTFFVCLDHNIAL